MKPMSRIKRPRNKARHLVAVRRSGNRIEYKWEPSTALRKAGWATVMLGEISFSDAVARAEEINARLDAWRAGVTLDANAPKMAPATRLHYSFADLWHHYSRDDKDGLLSKAKATQREYSSRARVLLTWTGNGKTRLRDIDADMVETLRNELVAGSSAYRAAAILRVLSTLMGYAERKRMIARGTDPAKRMKIPAAPKRRKRIAEETAIFLANTANSLGDYKLEAALLLGFYAIQRPADLRKLGPLNWREMRDLDPADRAVLAGNDGKVFGLRIKQGKTGHWVDTPLDHSMRVKIEAQLEYMKAQGADHIFFDRATGKQWHERQFNRDFRNIVDNHALPAAIAANDDWLVEQLTGLQYRDFRRSGMCWMRDNEATVEMIAARSGHSIEETTEILETYMPTDTRGSGAAYAKALANSQARFTEREQQG
jgi:hypothetical protein